MHAANITEMVLFQVVNGRWNSCVVTSTRPKSQTGCCGNESLPLLFLLQSASCLAYLVLPTASSSMGSTFLLTQASDLGC